jgi:thioredoxin-related protein
MDMNFQCVLPVMVFCFLTAWLLPSCGTSGQQADPLAGLEAYQKAGGKLKGDGMGLPSGADVNVSVSSGSVVDDEDIVWAPEDENVPMPGGLEELWKKPENKSWQTSYTEATKQSRQTGMPLLIWFTNSERSPLCRKLSDDLFSTDKFDFWASKRLVRLRVDDAIRGEQREQLGIGEYNDLMTRKRKYIDKLKKRYQVKGYPTVLILSPRGSKISNYRGYKRESVDYYWGRMKRDVSKAEDDYGAWLEKLEKRGYRMWTSRDGRKTFAKLHRYQPGKVTLVDPDGNRGVSSFRKLSDADQAWVMLEKKKYEARRNR